MMLMSQHENYSVLSMLFSSPISVHSHIKFLHSSGWYSFPHTAVQKILYKFIPVCPIKIIQICQTMFFFLSLLSSISMIYNFCLASEFSFRWYPANSRFMFNTHNVRSLSMIWNPPKNSVEVLRNLQLLQLLQYIVHCQVQLYWSMEAFIDLHGAFQPIYTHIYIF